MAMAMALTGWSGTVHMGSDRGPTVGDSEDVRVSSRGRRLLKKKMFDI